jgi:hypothetical protein
VLADVDVEGVVRVHAVGEPAFDDVGLLLDVVTVPGLTGFKIVCFVAVAMLYECAALCPCQTCVSSCMKVFLMLET